MSSLLFPEIAIHGPERLVKFSTKEAHFSVYISEIFGLQLHPLGKSRVSGTAGCAIIHMMVDFVAYGAINIYT
jgi:hypothetical protein